MSIYFIQPKPNGTVYIVGYDSFAARVRAFKLSRIQRVEILQSTYQMPFHLDTRRYLFYLRGVIKAKSARADD
jgi:predicted DNA-binding transcriptional regulator YafY